MRKFALSAAKGSGGADEGPAGVPVEPPQAMAAASPTDAATARIVDEVPTHVEYSVSRLADLLPQDGHLVGAFNSMGLQ